MRKMFERTTIKTVDMFDKVKVAKADKYEYVQKYSSQSDSPIPFSWHLIF